MCSDGLAHEPVAAVRVELGVALEHRSRSPRVLTSRRPTSSWLKRRRSSASSSSRKARSGHQSLPAATMASVPLTSASGPRMVTVAVRARDRTPARRTCSARCRRRLRARAARARRPGAASRRSTAPRAAWRARARRRRNFERGTVASTSPHSTARLPLMPSASVENTSARSRRTLRLSTRRVRPPVPGRTPSSGTSGSDTVDEPSSSSTISSQASASS